MVSTGKSLAEAPGALGIEEVDDSALVALCRQTGPGQPQDSLPR